MRCGSLCAAFVAFALSAQIRASVAAGRLYARYLFAAAENTRPDSGNTHPKREIPACSHDVDTPEAQNSKVCSFVFAINSRNYSPTRSQLRNSCLAPSRNQNSRLPTRRLQSFESNKNNQPISSKIIDG